MSPRKPKPKKEFGGVKYEDASIVKCQGHVLQLLGRNNQDMTKTLNTIVEDIGVSNVNTDSLG